MTELDPRRFEERLSRVLEIALGMGMLAMFLLIVTLVLMRYLFQAGLIGANETATVLFVYVSAIGSALAVGRNEHIRLDVLPKRFRPSTQGSLEVASLVLVGGLNLVLVVSGLVWLIKTGHTVMPATQMPRVFAQAAVPIGCLLATTYCATRIVTGRREERDG